MSKEKLCVSFSGGRTSAFMARWCQQNLAGQYDIKYVFANTGLEDQRTLDFVQRCDQEWELGVVWLEAVVHYNKKLGCTHKVVSYETAATDGTPFEEVIAKYGIPNKAYPHCTRELKLNPIRSYMKEVGWWGNCDMAVGIRADEIDRMQASAPKKRIIYPLIRHHPMDKESINRWWEAQPFKLELEELNGNCVTCWKKSERKLLTIAKSNPDLFEWNQRMEAQYGLSGHNVDGTPRVFFRSNTSTKDLIAKSKENFNPWTANQQISLFAEEDMPNGCSESCEVEF